MAQHPPLVLDAVLHADDRCRGRRHAELGERVVGVLPLHGQQHDRLPVGVGLPRHLRRVLGHGGTGRVTVSPGASRTRPDSQGPAVLAPRNQRDVVALLEQPAPDRATDGTGPHDDEAHGLHSATRRMPSSARGDLN